jgi:alkylation response protein AidB-like acyl-CoA dehydrogenase
VAVDGGYRVSGRWAFASGCRHATWFFGASDLYDGDAPRLGPEGRPESRFMLLPAADLEVVDTWDVSGLRGTGSHDVVADGAFVPEERSVAPGWEPPRPPRRPEPLYAFGLGVIPVGFAAVPLGIARRAIDALVELAGTKTHHQSAGLLRERPAAQAQVGQAEARLGAGRAYLLEAVRDAWEAVGRTGALTATQRMRLRLAAAEASRLAVQATGLAWRAGGATSLFASSPLDRCWRDVQAASRNIAINEANYEAAGRVLLGVAPGG